MLRSPAEMLMKNTKGPKILLLATGLVSGCTVGPDYAGPPKAAPLAQQAPHFHRASIAPADSVTPVARWWEPLGDPTLTWLIDTALAASPTLEAARARILQSRATLAQQRANLLPNGNGSAMALQGRLPIGDSGKLETRLNDALAQAAGSAGTTPPPTVDIPEHLDLSLYNAGFDATWEIDLFGGTRRGIEGARARTEAAVAQYEDAQVQLAANVGQVYVNLRDAQRRLELSRRTRSLQARMLELTLAKRRLGTASDLDVARLQAQIKQTDAQIPPLQGQIEQAMDRLAMFAGREPGTFDAQLSPQRALPVLPEAVPVGDPAAMLRRRPDIRAAERELASSNAAIGQAVARYFPTVSLIGSIGFAATDPKDLFDDAPSLLGVPILRWNFLDFGRVGAQVRQARAGMLESEAMYRNIVLQALQDAESSLSRFGRQRQNVASLGEALAETSRAARIAEIQYRGGTATALDALDGERQRVQLEQNLAQAQAQLVNDYIALQKSLGLGWKPFDWQRLSDSHTP